MSLAKISLQKGGKIIPLHVNNTETQGLGVTNPSVLVVGDEILVNIRNVKYNLFHSIGAEHYMDEGGKYQSIISPSIFTNSSNTAAKRQRNRCRAKLDASYRHARLFYEVVKSNRASKSRLTKRQDKRYVR